MLPYFVILIHLACAKSTSKWLDVDGDGNALELFVLDANEMSVRFFSSNWTHIGTTQVQVDLGDCNIELGAVWEENRIVLGACPEAEEVFGFALTMEGALDGSVVSWNRSVLGSMAGTEIAEGSEFGAAIGSFGLIDGDDDTAEILVGSNYGLNGAFPTLFVLSIASNLELVMIKEVELPPFGLPGGGVQISGFGFGGLVPERSFIFSMTSAPGFMLATLTNTGLELEWWSFLELPMGDYSLASIGRSPCDADGDGVADSLILGSKSGVPAWVLKLQDEEDLSTFFWTPMDQDDFWSDGDGSLASVSTEVGGCALLPTGNVSLLHRSVAVWRDGVLVFATIPCELGQRLTESSECESCPSGTAGVNGIVCEECAPGSFSNVGGSARCRPCARGTYASDYGAMSCQACLLNETSTSGSEKCVRKCDAGYFLVEEDDECVACEPGTYSVDSLQGCSPCPPGSFSSELASGFCEACAPGSVFFVEDGGGGGGAVQPPQPLSQPQQTENSGSGSNSSEVCIPCPAGRYSPIQGLVRVGSESQIIDHCIPCPAGRYSTQPGSDHCELCPPGTFSMAFAGNTPAVCSPCPPGSFSSSDGSSCEQCSPATYPRTTSTPLPKNRTCVLPYAIPEPWMAQPSITSSTAARQSWNDVYVGIAWPYSAPDAWTTGTAWIVLQDELAPNPRYLFAVLIHVRGFVDGKCVACNVVHEWEGVALASSPETIIWRRSPHVRSKVLTDAFRDDSAGASDVAAACATDGEAIVLRVPLSLPLNTNPTQKTLHITSQSSPNPSTPLPPPLNIKNLTIPFSIPDIPPNLFSLPTTTVSLQSEFLRPRPVHVFHNTFLKICARDREDIVRCSGYGFLENGFLSHQFDRPSPFDGKLRDLSTSITTLFAVLENGDVVSTGSNGDSRALLGVPNLHLEQTEDVFSVFLDGPAVSVAAASASACALLESRTVKCWGMLVPGLGRLGLTGPVSDDEHPLEASIGAPVVALEAGWDHFCALLESGAIRCWGGNSAGQLGYGHSVDLGLTATIASQGDVPIGTGRTVESVVLGVSATCVILQQSHDLLCFGTNTNGQLGTGDTELYGDNEPASATPLVNLDGPALQVAITNVGSCAIRRTDLELFCWGSGQFMGSGNEAELTLYPKRISVSSPPIQLIGDVNFVTVLDLAGHLNVAGSPDSIWGTGSTIQDLEEASVPDQTRLRVYRSWSDFLVADLPKLPRPSSQTPIPAFENHRFLTTNEESMRHIFSHPVVYAATGYDVYCVLLAVEYKQPLQVRCGGPTGATDGFDVKTARLVGSVPTPSFNFIQLSQTEVVHPTKLIASSLAVCALDGDVGKLYCWGRRDVLGFGAPQIIQETPVQFPIQGTVVDATFVKQSLCVLFEGSAVVQCVGTDTIRFNYYPHQNPWLLDVPLEDMEVIATTGDGNGPFSCVANSEGVTFCFEVFDVYSLRVVFDRPLQRHSMTSGTDKSVCGLVAGTNQVQCASSDGVAIWNDVDVGGMVQRIFFGGILYFGDGRIVQLRETFENEIFGLEPIGNPWILPQDFGRVVSACEYFTSPIIVSEFGEVLSLIRVEQTMELQLRQEVRVSNEPELLVPFESSISGSTVFGISPSHVLGDDIVEVDLPEFASPFFGTLPSATSLDLNTVRFDDMFRLCPLHLSSTPTGSVLCAMWPVSGSPLAAGVYVPSVIRSVVAPSVVSPVGGSSIQVLGSLEFLTASGPIEVFFGDFACVGVQVTLGGGGGEEDVLRCSLDAGIGSNLDLSIQSLTIASIPVLVGSYFEDPALRIAFDRPYATSIRPNVVSSIGGDMIQVFGVNFGLPEIHSAIGQGVLGSSVVVTVDDQPCSSVVVVSNTELYCFAPPGVSTDRPVRVFVGGQSADGTPPSISSSPPLVTSVTPSNVALGSTTAFSIHGTDLGLVKEDVVVFLGGIQCDDVHVHSPQHVSCTLDTHQNSSWPNPNTVSIAVGNQQRTFTGFVSTNLPPLLWAPVHIAAWRAVGDPQTLQVAWQADAWNVSVLRSVGGFFEIVVDGQSELNISMTAAHVDDVDGVVPKNSDMFDAFHTKLLVPEYPVTVKVRGHAGGKSTSAGELDDPVSAQCETTFFLLSSASNIEDRVCVPCVPGAVCPRSSSATNILQRQGFWRMPPADPYGPIGYAKCLNPSGCVGESEQEENVTSDAQTLSFAQSGGWSVPATNHPRDRSDPQCATGARGTLCATCANGYYRDGGTDTCQPCSASKSVNLVAFVLAILGLLIGLAIYTLYVHGKMMNFVKEKEKRGGSEVGALRIVVGHLQRIGIVLELVQVAWPSSTGSAYDSMQFIVLPVFDESSQCVLGASARDAVVTGALSAFAAPAAAILSLAVFWFLWPSIESSLPQCCTSIRRRLNLASHHGDDEEGTNNFRGPLFENGRSNGCQGRLSFVWWRMASTLVLLATMLHRPMTKTGLTLVSCVRLRPEGLPTELGVENLASISSWRLRFNPDEECIVPRRISLLVAIAIVGIVGIPLTLALALYRYREPITKSNWQDAGFQSLLFVHRNYRPKYYFYTVIEMAWTILLVASTVLLTEAGSLVQLLSAAAITTLDGAALSWLRPMSTRALALLAFAASIVSTLTFLSAAIVTVMLNGDSLSLSSSSAIQAIAIISFIANISIVLAGVYLASGTVRSLGRRFLCQRKSVPSSPQTPQNEEPTIPDTSNPMHDESN